MDSEAGPSGALSLLGDDYEVFLCFRGPDTGFPFTDFLYTSLNNAGVRTFRDDNELRKGEEISPELLKAIKESKICIPIFSKNYTSSKWCLEELAKMVECKRSTPQRILPIFYHVKPSDVRHQSGFSEEAFHKHESSFHENTVKEWKEVLREAGALKGWEVENATDRYQEKLIKEKIVPTILLELKKNCMAVDDNLVGIHHYINQMMSLLDVVSDEVRVVGIVGRGGIGKTTIAKIIYNKLFESFECRSFLTVQLDKSLVSLQRKLLTETLNWCPNIVDVNIGLEIIQQRFVKKKVLIVLDNVNADFQFTSLVGNGNCFGPGSRIIVTTRSKYLLLRGIEVDGVCELQPMNCVQSLEIFSMHAFRQRSPPKKYHDISQKIAFSIVGHPLTLEVIGSLLSNKKETFWNETLKKLKNIPSPEVLKTLMISDRALSFEQQQIFLDIACLFVGMDKTYPFYMWDACGYHPEIEINVLCLMSLVKMEDDNVLWMHDQLRDFGRRIAGEENVTNPRKRSRVWDYALEILKEGRGDKEVETLSLDFESRSQPCFTNEEFVNLRNLRYLQLDGVELDGDFKHLLSELRWLNWRCCPRHFKPTNFHLKNLVILDLSHSDITEEWEGWSQMKMAKKLKVLELAGCAFRRTPDFSTYESLEILILRRCVCLSEIDHSVGSLRNLKVLDVSYTPIRNIPDEIWMLEKLELVDATACYYLRGDIPSPLCVRGPSSFRY